MISQTYLSYAGLHAERGRHRVNDNYDDDVYLSAEVEKGRQGLNDCSVMALLRALHKPGREKECGRWRVGKRGE